MATDPPEALVRSLVDGPSRVSGFEWHRTTGSTNAVAAEAAARGAPAWHVVAADEQTAGRGRGGRSWSAAPGTALLMSVVLRPHVDPGRFPLLSLLAGLAVAEVLEAHVAAGAAPAGVEVGLKWPNDVLVRRGSVGSTPPGAPGATWGKVAGILLEMPAPGVVILGVGCNVDWRGAPPPAVAADALPAVSLSEVRGAPVDRWRLLPALLGVLGNRYDVWCERPGDFLDAYRSRCVTLGQQVRVTRAGAAPLEGTAVGITDHGALVVQPAAGHAGADRRVEVSAGEVTHVRPA